MSAAETALTIEQYRRFYAEELRVLANLEAPLVEAFARVPREQFLGAPPWQFHGETYLQPGAARKTEDPRDVYHNVVIALKAGQSLNNGQPGALAAWIAGLGLAEGESVFHVGCGTGYYTAVMAEVVGPAGSIVAAEVEPDLAEQAAENLRGYDHVRVHAGDGAAMDPGACDAIFVNAGVTHPHRAWLERLKDGGRLILPLTVTMAPRLGKGFMAKITRRGDRFAAAIISMVAIYSSASMRDAAIEPLLGKAFESRELMKLKSVRVDAHEAAATCIVHAGEVCLSAAG